MTRSGWVRPRPDLCLSHPTALDVWYPDWETLDILWFSDIISVE
jgi:hypothetical protein